MSREDIDIAVREFLGAEHDLHETLRRSHCDHIESKDPRHACVGTTVITPTGTKLSCKLCGKCELHSAPITVRGLVRHAEKIQETILPALSNFLYAGRVLEEERQKDPDEP